MRLGKFSDIIQPSPTLALNAKAAELKRNGVDVIHLGGGEPKWYAPQEAIKEAEKLLETRVVRYTPVSGSPELKDAIIDYTEKYYGKSVARENVIVSSGAKQALMIALLAVLNFGEEVIFPAPYWVSYPDMVKLAGGAPVVVQPESADFQITFDEIIAKVTDKTKAILINSPNNPSGAVYKKDLFEQLANFCEKHEIFLILDDIYRELTFDGEKSPNGFEYAKEDINNSYVLSINGVSKQFAMTGFRIGWAVGAKELIASMTRIQGHQTSCPSAVSQVAALGALRGGEKEAEELKFSLVKKRETLVHEISKIEKVKLIPPRATFYSFADFSAYEKNSHKLAEYLIDVAKVVTIPGKDFGIDGHLRISFCGPEDELIEGIARIKEAIYKYKS